MLLTGPVQPLVFVHLHHTAPLHIRQLVTANSAARALYVTAQVPSGFFT